MITRTLFALGALLSVAHAGTHEVWVGSHHRTLPTASANAVTEDGLDGPSLGYAHALGLELMPGLQLWAEAEIVGGVVEGRIFQTMTTDLSTWAFTVGARARYPLHDRIIANARVSLGAARAALDLRDGSGHSATDSGWGGISIATLGVDLVVLRHPKAAFGLRIDGGVVGATPIGLVAKPVSDGNGTLQLEMSASGLGSLNLSGSMFTASLFSEF